MHNCAAPLSAETSMRVSTPGRHCSSGLSLGSLTFMNFGPLFAGTVQLGKQTLGFHARDNTVRTGLLNHSTMDHP
jgi:hypothetical protein